MDFGSILNSLTAADVVAVLLGGAGVLALVGYTAAVARQVAGFFDGSNARRDDAWVRLQQRNRRNGG